MFDKIKEKLDTIGRETLYVVLAVLLLFAAVPFILVFLPLSGMVDIGGEIHVMLKGFVVFTSALFVTVATHWVGLKTHWIYAIKSGKKHDPNNELPSYKEDFLSADTPAKRFRCILFSTTFIIIFLAAIYCLTPDAIILNK